MTLHGDIVRQHKDQVLGLARNEEAAEKGEHPLNRIIGIEETDEGLVISTTDIHLPRRIGKRSSAHSTGSSLCISTRRAISFGLTGTRRPEAVSNRSRLSGTSYRAI